MAWSQAKNQVFFQRAQNWAASMMNLLEERQRLIDQYTNEASPGGTDEATFVDVPEICTKAELIALSVNVMTPLNNMMFNTGGTFGTAVPARNRIQDLTPLLTNQQ